MQCFFGDGLSKCLTKLMYYLDNSILDMACLLTHIRFWNSDKFAGLFGMGLFGMLQMERLADMKNQLDKIKKSGKYISVIGQYIITSWEADTRSACPARPWWCRPRRWSSPSCSSPPRASPTPSAAALADSSLQSTLFKLWKLIDWICHWLANVDWPDLASGVKFVV